MAAETVTRRIAVRKLVWGATLFLGAIAAVKAYVGESVKKPIPLLKAHVGIQAKVPDPAKIELAGDWYFLYHVSSGLVGFDHIAGKFRPLLAESWEAHSSGVHTFTLRDDARFHDGTPITSEDVIASIKRLLIKKTSTHFPLWEYVEGCEGIKNLRSHCPGLHAVNHRTIEIRLKHPSESFFLQIASPETGIWSRDDIDPITLELTPKKFSGPYFVESMDSGAAHLVRNEQSPVSKEFSYSPRKIDLAVAKLNIAEERFKKGKIDILFKSHNPCGEEDWTQGEFSRIASSLSTLIYLYGTSTKGAEKIGRDFMEALWDGNPDKEVVAAQKFLPFAGDFGIGVKEFLENLPEKTAKNIRIAVPWTYLSDGFLNLLTETGKKVGAEIEIMRLPREDWIRAFDDEAAVKRFDFILAPYAASERYPAVQLRYITGALKKAPIDLKTAEVPDLTPDKVAVLRDYQKWLLKKQHAVPLFFVRDFFLYQKHIDMGEQPSSDAEIELWRVFEK